MKSNKEIKNLSTEAELPKDSIKENKHNFYNLLEEIKLTDKLDTKQNIQGTFDYLCELNNGLNFQIDNLMEDKKELKNDIERLNNSLEATDSMLKTMQKAHFDIENKYNRLKLIFEGIGNVKGNDMDKLLDIGKILDENNQLKSQLNSQTEKIKELIEFWNREKPQNLIVIPEKITELKTDDLFNFCRNLVVEELKSLLESGKENADGSHASRLDKRTSNLSENSKGEKEG